MRGRDRVRCFAGGRGEILLAGRDLAMRLLNLGCKASGEMLLT